MFLEDKQYTFWAPLQLTWTPLAPCLNHIQHIHSQQQTTRRCSNSTCQKVNVAYKDTLEHSVPPAWEPLARPPVPSVGTPQPVLLSVNTELSDIL